VPARSLRGSACRTCAACLELGLEPVGLVPRILARWQQGVYSYDGTLSRASRPTEDPRAGYVQNYQCPHGMIAGEHRMWGQNYQQTWVEKCVERRLHEFVLAHAVKKRLSSGAHGRRWVVGRYGEAVDRAPTVTGVVTYRVRAVKVLDTPARRVNALEHVSGRAASREGLRSGLRAGVDCRVRLINPGVGVLRHRVPDGRYGHVVKLDEPHRDRTDRHPRCLKRRFMVRTSARDSTPRRRAARRGLATQ